MRIAILTLPLHTNYGQILQCYALQTYLQKLGHSVVVLDDARYTIEYYLKIPFVYLKRAIRRFVLKDPIEIFVLPYQKERIEIQKFIDNKICRKGVRSWNACSIKNYDAYVVGSDQVWRPQYFISDRRPSIDIAFLSFVHRKNAKKVSYAASFGTDEIGYTFEQRTICSKLVKDFNAVSVREDSAVNLCRELFGINAVHVIDPTMLLCKEDYVRFFNKGNEVNSESLFVYLLDRHECLDGVINNIISETSWILDYCGKDIMENTKISVKPSVEQWINGFNKATFVITDSFHGCVFSILFNKPFAVYTNENRGIARIKSLLNMFGLMNHLIEKDSSCDYKSLLDVDWIRVNTILDKERQKAYDFLSILNN